LDPAPPRREVAEFDQNKLPTKPLYNLELWLSSFYAGIVSIVREQALEAAIVHNAIVSQAF
jgi:hypothetical protein